MKCKKLMSVAAAAALLCTMALPTGAAYTNEDVARAYQAAADRREAAYARSVKAYQRSIAQREAAYLKSVENYKKQAEAQNQAYLASLIAEANRMYR